VHVKRKDIGCVREAERSEAPGKSTKRDEPSQRVQPPRKQRKLSLCAKDEGFFIRVDHSEGQSV